jgi:hypothetical protein
MANEGLAVVIERTIQRRTFLLDKDVVDRHAKHWTDKTIQTFWAGTSWYIPGDSNELSYSLAEILLTLLAEEGHSLIEFIKHADWHDAGEDAALNFLGKDLGDPCPTPFKKGRGRLVLWPHRFSFGLLVVFVSLCASLDRSGLREGACHRS